MSAVEKKRRIGAYAKLLANYASDDALIGAGEAAELLFVRGLAFCATSDSDGYITEAQLVRYVGAGMKDTARRAKRLVDAGLWLRAEGGYVVKNWTLYHETAEEKGYKRKLDRERKRATPSSEIQTDSTRNPDGVREEGVAESLYCSYVSTVGEQQDRTGQSRAGNPPADSPSPYCPKHPTGTDEPCGACGLARKRYQAWHADRENLIRAERDAAKRARETCPDCHGAVWLDDGTKCTHPKSRRTA